MLGAIAVEPSVAACASGLGAGCALAALLGLEAEVLLRRDQACRCVCEAPRQPWIELGSGWLAFGLLLAFLLGVICGVVGARRCLISRVSTSGPRRPWGNAVLTAYPHGSGS